MKNVFRLRHLATKQVSVKQAGGIGTVGLLGPDQDPDDFSPITPVIMSAKVKSRLAFLDAFKGRVDELELATLDDVALEVGRAIVGSRFIDTALCSVDMPTCAANQRISPVASIAETVTSADLAIARTELKQALDMIDRLER